MRPVRPDPCGRECGTTDATDSAMRILVVEDEGLLARAVHRRLRGHDVAIELDSTKAVERVEAAEAAGEPYDLLLCGYPPVSAVILSVRTRMRTRAPTLILITDYDNAVDAAFIADEVLVKPFSATELVETTERWRARR
jgi:DNA-binding response OmpR family regulator